LAAWDTLVEKARAERDALSIWAIRRESGAQCAAARVATEPESNYTAAMIIDGNCQFFGKGEVGPLLRRMDGAGIDKAVLAASLEGAQMPGRNGPLADVGNRDVAAAVAAHADRFIGCMHVNPLDPDSMRTVGEYAARGFKAVKLFPAEGYHPDDPRFYELFDAIQDKGLAAILCMGQINFSLAHEGGKRRALNSAYAYPMRVDAPSRLFPKIRFVIQHMGFPFLFEAWSVHHANKNVYLDISGTGPCFDGLPVGYAALGGSAFIPLDFDKVVWGSDNVPDPLSARAVADSYLGLMGCSDAARRAHVFGATMASLLGLSA
jgi:predicted TIM-barrel fold metal-dependent hydrolase